MKSWWPENTKVTTVTTKVSPTLSVPNFGNQYKSHLVALLNQNPKLSHDRLTRVRQKQDTEEKNRLTSGPSDKKSISLFDEYAFIAENTVRFGKLLRMRKKGKARGYIEYKYPVSFADPTLKDIQCLLQQYHPSSATPNTFDVKNQNIAEVPASRIITHVNFTYDPVKEVVKGDSEELLVIMTQFESQRRGKAKKTVSSPSSWHTAIAKNTIENEGVLHTTVVPAVDETGARRSKRVRTVISHLSDYIGF